MNVSRTSKLILLGLTLVLVLAAETVWAQRNPENLIKDLSWRNIGPANMSGRIADIEAYDDDFATVYVGSASGGVWKSVNAGASWTPIFDDYGAASIGDVAIHQKDRNLVWVGTGERNRRNSATWGDGVYKSTDGGETFTHMGLANTYVTGRIIVHPDNTDIVYVAAAGCTWGFDVGDRGLFMSTNGGQSWRKLTNGLPNDGKTGAIDLVMHPTNPNELYVAFWQVLRTSYRLDSGGPNGGIFKTTDGGRTWRKLTKGLPAGDSGKIGLAISRSNPQVLMSMYEHGFQPGRNDPDYSDLANKPGTGLYRSEDSGETWENVNRYNNRPFYYSHVWINPQDDKMVYVLAGGFQMSNDGGYTLRSAPGGLHSDYHALWLDPNNKNRFYVGNDGGCALTHNHGNGYIFFDNYVISQFYMLGIDMRDPYYVYGGLQDNGTWGGPSRSRDRSGILTDHWFTISGGDGYHAQVDPTDWRTVYSEPHPGNTGGRIQKINIETRQVTQIRPQKGENIVNYDDYITPEIEQLQLENGWGPSPGSGMGAFRWNWSSPIVMSPHNPDTVFFGANHLFKTTDQGESWYLISPDLSKNEYHKTIKESGGLTADHNPGGGAEFHGTIITISESPVKAGIIWVGTDDGNVQVTRNGGFTWTNVRAAVPLEPQDIWVSRVEASHFDAGACYLSLDGHRSGIFKPMVYKTTDYGKTWENITSNIPDDEPVYVIKEDLKNPDLLFVGTEFSVFYSINDGRSWTKLNNNLPTVAVHDLVIHPRDGDLIAGTHGRGIWIMDDITPLQQATREVLRSDAHLFESRPATKWLNISRGGSRGHLYYRGENPTSNAVINYYIGANPTGSVEFKISDITGDLTRSFTFNAQSGINRFEWDMRLSRAGQPAIQVATGRGGRGGRGGVSAEVGEYVMEMTYKGNTYNTKLVIRDDPLLSGTK